MKIAQFARNGDHLTWSQRITRSMPLDLRFDVRIDGGELTGTSKAGRLRPSKVVGSRDLTP